jgi:type I restriction enzyme, S subunit
MADGNGQGGELPKGWIWGQHKEIAQINPKIPFGELSNDLVVSFLPMAAVEEKTGKFSLSEVREYQNTRKGYTPFINGDIIFAKITPCMENGKIAVVKDLENGIGFGSTEFHVSRLSELLNKKYFFHFLNQECFRRDARQYMTGSAGQLRVSKSYFEEIFFPISPLSEQTRIVEKIEELFSDLDAGIESLKKARQQLKIYRQAVLKWAFEGKLTEGWREEAKQQGIPLKTGAELLEEIKVEREKRYRRQVREWEGAIAQWEQEGRSGKKPKKPQKLKELAPLTEHELQSFPKLPNKWCWEKLGNVADIVGGVTKGRKLNGKEIISLPYLRVANVQDGYLDLSVIKYIDALQEDLDKYLLLAGDILYTEGGDKDKLGRGTIWKEEIKNCIHQNHIFRARLLTNFLIPFFVSYFSRTQLAKYYFFKRAKQTVNLASINMTILSNFPVPVTDHFEQQQIVEEIESRLSICDQIETAIAENLQRAEALRQSILKRAFAGKLVPQDPNDEPAELLLERIRQEKATAQKPKKKATSETIQLHLDGLAAESEP